jgi:hypothetical protein
LPISDRASIEATQAGVEDPVVVGVVGVVGVELAPLVVGDVPVLGAGSVVAAWVRATVCVPPPPEPPHAPSAAPAATALSAAQRARVDRMG